MALEDDMDVHVVKLVLVLKQTLILMSCIEDMKPS